MDEKVYGYMDWPRIEAIVYGEETAPRDVMGPRITQDGVLIQGFFPDAEEVSVISGKKTYVCEKEDEAGYFAVLLPVRKVPEYRFLIKMGETETECYDPYAFPCQITEEEEKAFCAGVYYEAYKKLGAHPMEIKGVKGTLFAVWAPNAVSVNIAGDFNGWIGRATIMHRMSGIFELFVPGVEAGTHYKYEIKVKGGEVLLKADPYGNSADHDPEGASVVADVSAFQWNDGDWMKERHRFDDRKQPVSIYETSLEEWKSAEELVEFLAEEDFTHVELHPVMEYLDDITGGYSTYAYYAPTSRFGSVADFQKLVDELHQAGVGVILDWTPAQFPRYASGLEKFDGTPLYERQNPAEAIHPFWGTLLYNYGSPMVKDFLISNACFWAEVYHADGLRMDDVDAMLYLDYGRNPGEWTPNIYGTNENLDALEFLKHLNSVIKERNPGLLLVAQENGLWPELTDSVENDHLGFDYKWDMGWMNDTLDYFRIHPYDRKFHYHKLSFSMMYFYNEHYLLPFSHDEVVHGKATILQKMWGEYDLKFQQAKTLYTYMYTHPGKKLNFMGNEIGQFREWDEEKECDWMLLDYPKHQDFHRFMKDLNHLYISEPAFFNGDYNSVNFRWIEVEAVEERVYIYERMCGEDHFIVVLNMSDAQYNDFEFGYDHYAVLHEVLSGERKEYGGYFEGPKEDIVAKTTGYKWWKRKFKITIPALAAIIYKVEFLPEPKEIPLPMLDEASIDIDRKRLRAEHEN